MRTFTDAEVQDYIIEIASDSNPCEMDVDNSGQLTIHTGIYRWQDGTLHDQAENETKT